MNTPPYTLTDLFHDLERHDWFHDMSDDYSVTLRGRNDWKRIQWHSEQLGPKGAEMLEDFTAWKSTSGEASPKPVLAHYVPQLPSGQNS